MGESRKPEPVAAWKTVVFDAVGTLIHPRVPVYQTYGAIAQRFGLEVSTEQIAQRFADAYRLHGRKSYADWGLAEGVRGVDYESTEIRRWRAIVGAVFPESSSIERLFSELWDYYADPQHWCVFDDVERTWAALRARGIQIVIASNFDQRLVKIQQQCRLLSTCDRLFISSQVGFVKPQPDFYRAISDELRLQPNHMLMVGDDWENDYLAPRRAGWQAVPLRRRDAATAPPVIRSLDALL